MNSGDKDLRNAVKNAREAFYEHKQKHKKVFRKEARRNKRLAKKTKQFQSQLKRNVAKESVTDEKPQKPQEPQQREEHLKKKKKKKKRKVTESADQTNDDFCYEKYAHEAANKRDEKMISSLGKKLGFKKNKMPGVFQQEGLDFLLEVCGPLTGAGDVDGDSDEEYLKMKKMARKRPKLEEDTKKELDKKEMKYKLLFGGDVSDDHDESVNDGECESNMDSEEIDEDLDNRSDNDYNDDGDEIGDLEDSTNGVSEDELEGDRVTKTDKNNIRNTSKSPSGKYLPPALRKIQAKEDVNKEKQRKIRLTKQLKGLLNRVSEHTLPGIISDIKSMYETNSRNAINEILFTLISEACIMEAVTPQRLALQHMVIVVALQKTTNSEVGSYFLQMLVEQFDQLHQVENSSYGGGKKCLNTLFLIVSLYNFKIVDCILIYDVIRRLLNNFLEQDIEMLLMILRTCGSEVRKDDPESLKAVILEVQAKSISSQIGDQSRIRYMLETITALKNNNMRKIAQYDPTVLEEANRVLKVAVREKDSTSDNIRLKVTLEDLLNAREKGKWWVIGSAWTGRGPVAPSHNKTDSVDNGNEENVVDVSTNLLEVAKKQRMNTNLRKNIFCILMSSEDYLDAFEKLQKMNLTEKQAREIIHVVLDCCVQEKSYNPFYSHLIDQFCGASHSNKVTLQYAFWDRFKEISSLAKHGRSNMALILAHLITTKSLSLSVLKVISFGALDKASIRFFVEFFQTLMTKYPENTVKASFQRIASISKLSILRESIKLFLRHFLSKHLITNNRKMNDLIEIAESALDGQEYTPF